MSTWHPSSPPSAVITPPIPNNIDEDGHHDLETVVLPSKDAEPAAPEFGASTLPQHTSRRRGYTQHGPVLTCIFASDSDFTANGNGEGGAAQARHIDGDAHVTIDMTALPQGAALSPAPTETELASVTNRELDTILSSFFRCVDGGPTRYILTVRGTDNVGGEPNNNKTSQHSAAKYAKLLLTLFGVCLSACSAAFPVIKQGAPDEYVVLAYGLLAVLALVLLAGLLATSFDKSPSSVVWGKYALQLALGLTIGFLTWSVCSLSPSHEFSVPISIAGALVYIIVVLLFWCRKW